LPLGSSAPVPLPKGTSAAVPTPVESNAKPKTMCAFNSGPVRLENPEGINPRIGNLIFLSDFWVIVVGNEIFIAVLNKCRSRLLVRVAVKMEHFNYFNLLISSLRFVKRKDDLRIAYSVLDGFASLTS